MGIQGNPVRRAQCRAILTATVVALCVAAGGCAGRSYYSAERIDKGLVLVLPGIEGPSSWNRSICDGLVVGEALYAVETYNWTGSFGVYYVFNHGACRDRARDIADYVMDYQRKFPGRPTFVVGHSAGGAVAVMVAEEMPPTAPLTGVVAIAPSLSADYDLSRAVAGCGGRFVNCYDTGDNFLQALTVIGSNIDGSRSTTAGKQGFVLPEDADNEERLAYAQLRQIRWSESMEEDGNGGGHFGWTNPEWVADNIVPMLDEWASVEMARTHSRVHALFRPAAK